LLSIPSTLAENAGLSPIETCTRLIGDHQNGQLYEGVDVLNHSTANLKDIVWEPMKLKESVLVTATEVVSMILRIDQILNAGV
jgi:chaperonin GroEL (HSP60 family)